MRKIFVFGSNLAGIHEAGSALAAKSSWGATQGLGQGPMGRAYAIPTKDKYLNTLSLNRIEEYVNIFLEYAEDHPELQFRIVKIGCGLAGYHDEDIAPMFRGAPGNCVCHPDWEKYLT